MKRMGETFAFLLPIMMFMFGCAFLTVWRWGARAALPWGVGYICAAAAFSVPVLCAAFPGAKLAVLADTLFATSFFFYGQALLVHLRAPLYLRARLAIWAGAIGLAIVSVHVIGSMRAEIVTNDYSCTALLVFPWLILRKRIDRPIDRALLAITTLVMLDNVTRASTVFLTTPDQSHQLLSTFYGFVMQTTATVFGMIFALTGLAAVTLDMLADYRAEALTDPLTGLLNRRGFERAVVRLKAGAPAGSVVTCDIDHFKRVNDTFGHAAGDRVIAALAELIRARLPAGAIAARFGGEEFVVHLPRSNAAEATRFANAVRLSFSAHEWTDVDGPLTVSFGLSAVQAEDASLDDAIQRADEGLYDAKKAGRNRVSIKFALVPSDRRAPPTDPDARQRAAGSSFG